MIGLNGIDYPLADGEMYIKKWSYGRREYKKEKIVGARFSMNLASID